MTKLCLLTSTAIVKRFQTKISQVHPSDRLPFPLEFRKWQKTRLVVYKAEKKVWWYLYPIRYNNGVWRTLHDGIDRAMQSVARVKTR